MVPAAIIGPRVGRALLSGVDEKVFLIAFRMMLIVLALKLILFDGLGCAFASTASLSLFRLSES